MEAKQLREQAFHDRIFADDTRAKANKYYSVLRNSRIFFEAFLNRHRGDEVLEYGCGPGSYAFYLGRRGASVTGIDISNTAIHLATEQASAENLSTIRFRLMDAERLEFKPATFDLICGIAILHHLDLDKAYQEIARTMKPGGRAVFMEPLGHNPVINAYRRLTPTFRTVDEHPLLMRDIKLAHKYFHDVKAHYFTLNSLLAVPLRETSAFPQVLAALDGVDSLMFRWLPLARRYAWQVVLTVGKPRTSLQSATN